MDEKNVLSGIKEQKKLRKMKQLTFSENVLNAIDTKDFANFVSMLTCDTKFDDKKVHVNRVRFIESTYETMVTVEIDFQVWNEGECGTGAQMTWICYRALNHSCMSGVRFEESKVSKLLKRYDEVGLIMEVFEAVNELDKTQQAIFLDAINSRK